MKGFPPTVSGHRGQWYRKVNDAVASVLVGQSVEELIAVLGEPDERTRERSPSSELQETLSGLAGGSTSIRYRGATGEALVFIDPYRPGRRYLFTIVDSVVVQKGRVDTVKAT